MFLLHLYIGLIKYQIMRNWSFDLHYLLGRPPWDTKVTPPEVVELIGGEVLPPGALQTLKGFHAIYLGAIGHPEVKPGILETGILLSLRFGLDQYINLRPVKLYPNVETPLANKGPEEIDFVAYISVGTGIVVPTGNPNNIQDLDDLCGLTVAVQVGTIQEQMLNDQNEECDEPVDIVTFDTNPLAVEDLRTGGSDANFSDFPVAAEDAAQSDGDLEVVEPQIDPEPYGVGIRKGSTELKDAITDAIQAIRDSGRAAIVRVCAFDKRDVPISVSSV